MRVFEVAIDRLNSNISKSKHCFVLRPFLSASGFSALHDEVNTKTKINYQD